MTTFSIRPTTQHDASSVAAYMTERWGSAVAVAHGELFRPAELPGFVALGNEEEWMGLLTYQIVDAACEIVTLNSNRSGYGVGTALIEAAQRAASVAGCTRLWLITTNDNWPAIRFYQKRGFHMISVRPNAVDESRKLKPEIPLTGIDGIPIRDEIEFEISLGQSG